MLHPYAGPPGPVSDRQTPQREQVRFSQQGECGVHYTWSLTVLPAPGDPTQGVFGEDLVLSARGGFTPLPLPGINQGHRSGAALSGRGKSGPHSSALCACAGFPWRPRRESETPARVPPSPVPCWVSAAPSFALPQTYSLLFVTRNKFMISF